jgi:hypothetical protein
MGNGEGLTMETKEILRGLAEHAIEWELQPETSACAGDEVILARRDGFNGRRWAIKQRGYVLNKSGEWEWEPQPSSRTEEWLKTVRWNTIEEAQVAWTAAKAKLEKASDERQAQANSRASEGHPRGAETGQELEGRK